MTDLLINAFAWLLAAVAYVAMEMLHNAYDAAERLHGAEVGR